MAEAGPLRIALLTHSVNPRGGVVHTVELAQALHDAGHDVTVLAPALPGQRLFRPLRCAVELVPAAPPPGGDAAGRVRRMVRSRIDAYVAHLSAWPRRHEIDVWHAHDGIGGNALADLARWGELAPHCAVVRTVHHLDRFDDAVLMGWQARAWRSADRLLCVSRGWVEAMAEQEGARADEVHNGVCLERWRPPAAIGAARRAAEAHSLRGLGVRPGAQVVLAVGGIEERKNTLRLLQAFVRLQAQSPADRQLVIVGGASLLDHDAYAREFAAAVAGCGLRSGPGEDLLPTGPVDDALMPALFRRCSLLAMPSLREGFGLVVLEALASGAPVLVSRRAPFTEYLDDGLAEFVDPLNVVSIAEGLARALARGRGDHRLPAAQALCERYGWPASARRHAAIYRDTLTRRRAQRPPAEPTAPSIHPPRGPLQLVF